MSDASEAVVLGGGSWGTALAHVLASHGHKTVLWMRNEDRATEINEKRTNTYYLGDQPIHEGVEATTDLAFAAGFSETIVVAIPSKALRSVAFELGHHITGDQILISATKGLDIETFTRMSEILREETCARKVGALSGPNLSAEVMAGHPSATVVASRFEEVIEKAEQLLAGPRFRLYGNFDIVGVELAGALKNIVAIASGACAALGFGANTLSLLMTRGLAEMSRMGERMSAERLTFTGLAGIGDLICTCSSTLSRNYTVGRLLAEGNSLEGVREQMHQVAEGVNTAKAVHGNAKRLGVDMPIAEAVHRVLFEGAEIQQTLHELMTRKSRYEVSYSVISESFSVSGSVMEAAARASR